MFSIFIPGIDETLIQFIALLDIKLSVFYEQDRFSISTSDAEIYIWTSPGYAFPQNQRLE